MILCGARRGAALGATRGRMVLPQSVRVSSSCNEEDESCVVRATDGSDGDGVNAGACRHRVRFKDTDVMVAHGETLRTALLRTGTVTPHNGRAQLINCRGLGTCGTCAVEIKGDVVPRAWNTRERLRFNLPPHSAPGNKKLRLACQVRVEGALGVTKYDRFWGEGDAESTDLTQSLPLGELEFIFDAHKVNKDT